MKKANLLFSIILLLLVHTISMASSSETITKEKKVNGHFNVQPNDILAIENKYGLVHINTWDKNEITVDITITVHAKTEEQAQDLIGRISISEKSNEKGGNRISYKTIIDNIQTHNMEEFTIDYTINMPKKNPLEVTNKFGNIYLDDFQGSLMLDLGYGALTASKLSGKDKQIEVKFGSATISSMDFGILKMSYSKLSIGKAINLTITNKFGKTNIGEAGYIMLDQGYGDVSIGDIGELNGSVSYADLEVGKLSWKTDMDLKYCGKADFKSILTGAELVKVKSNFSNILLGLAADNSFNIDMALSYGEMKGELKNKTQYPIEYTTTSRRNSSGTHYFKGKTGKGDGTMDIQCKYGNVVFK